MPDASRRQSALRNHCPPLRKIAPSTAPSTEPNPPTTAAVNVMRFSSGGKRPSVNWPLTCTSTTPAIDAKKPEIANAVSLAPTADTP